MSLRSDLESIDFRSVAIFWIAIALIFSIGFLYEAYSESDNINNIIKDGLNECSDLDKPNCLGVMAVLDELCKVDYYPNCFGDEWNSYFKYMRDLYKSGHFGEYNDQYWTVNNEHFGNGSVMEID